MAESQKEQRPNFALGVAIAAVLVCFIVNYQSPSMSSRPAVPRAICANRVRQLGIALHSYHDVYDAFPPAHAVDARGWPRHSWRVLALPYLEENGLYHRYRFDEPWNGPHNSRYNAITLTIYQCPSDAAAWSESGPWTSYVAVVGPHTTWPGAESVPIREITDGTANTLLIAECHNTGIHWMEPRDLHVGQMAPTINPPGGQGVSILHEGGANIALSDGSVRFVSQHIDPEVLRRLIERDDGEGVGEF